MSKQLKPIMFVGTGSDVGKSIVATGFCRILLQRGYHPAPFKAQNMSLNSYPTPEEGEIGRAQAVQAEACGIPCHTDMNPILLKPTADETTQVILNGRAVGNQSARAYFNVEQRKPLFVEAMKAYDRLAAKFNPIVIEGAGSISEVNLWPMDIVNMRVALRTGADVYLVADIERGGIFGSLYGTIELLPPAERAAIKGIIVNKFRGDSTLFDSGRQIIQDLTRVPVVGVLPYIPHLQIDAEDGVSIDSYETRPNPESINIAVVRLPHISNFTDFDTLRYIPGVTLYFTAEAKHLQTADIIMLPGSKNTIDDLLWLRREGLDAVIQSHHKEGRPLYGICGGYQMMGQRIADPDGVEGASRTVEALGLLPVETILQEGKAVRTSTFTYLPTGATSCQGYEIHCGETTPIDAPASPVVLRGASDKTPDGYFVSARLWGSYMHGIWDNEQVVRHILHEIAPQRTFTFERTLKSREQAYDLLAQGMSEHLDLEYMLDSMRSL